MNTEVVKFGLRGKLLLLILPLVNLAFFGVWFIATETARGGLLQLSDTNLVQGSKSLGDAIAQGMNDAFADAMTTARLDLAAQAIETADPKNLVWYADEAVRTKHRYSAIVVTDKEGRVVGANTVSRDGKKLSVTLVGRSVAMEPWFSTTLRSTDRNQAVAIPIGRPAVLDGVLGSDEAVAGFSFPVVDLLDEKIGTLVVFVSMNALGSLLDGFAVVNPQGGDSLAPESFAAVVDQGGHPIILPSKLSSSSSTLARAQLPMSAATSRWTNPNGGVSYFVSSQPIGGAIGDWKWRLVALKTSKSLEAPIDKMTRQLMGVSAIAVLLAMTAIFWIATRLVHPIRTLTAASASTERASEYKPLAVESSDEVGVLTQSFNRMLAAIHDHQVGLEDKIAERTSELAEAKYEVTEILDNMAQAIFTVGQDMRVGVQFSAYTKTLFGDDVVIAGAHVLELLQVGDRADGSGGGGGSNPVAAANGPKMRSWFASVLGNDDFQWMLAQSEVVRTHTLMIRSADAALQQREVEIEYAPIYKDGNVDRVMVLVKDVTDVRTLENEVVRKEAENNENLSRLAEVVSIDRELFETFVVEAADVLTQCREAADVLEARPNDREGIDRLFRAMHTLKGNARVFKMTTVQNVAHGVETFFTRIRDGEERVTPAVITDVRAKLAEVESLLESFERLSRHVLGGGTAMVTGRGGGGGSCGGSGGTSSSSSSRAVKIPESRILELRRQYVELVRSLKENSATTRLEIGHHQQLAKLDDALQSLTTVPLTEIFDRCRKMTFDLAQELGKNVADLEVVDNGVEVDIRVADKIRDVLMHAVRNALDHGIEMPGERLASKKPEKGTIRVFCEHNADGKLAIHITDDGRGVNLDSVRDVALRKGFLKEEEIDSMPDEALLQLLFQPGFSTAKKVSDVSGRGVGMDVISTSVRGLSGEVVIHSQFGKGTSLILELPVHTSRCTAATTTTTTATTTTTTRDKSTSSLSPKAA